MVEGRVLHLDPVGVDVVASMPFSRSIAVWRHAGGVAQIGEVVGDQQQRGAFVEAVVDSPPRSALGSARKAPSFGSEARKPGVEVGWQHCRRRCSFK